MSLVLGFHISLLPFHTHGFNVLRGGIFATVLWSLIASAITSSYATDSNGVDGMMPLVLLAMMPAAFIVGAMLVHHKKARVLSYMKILRQEQGKVPREAASSSQPAEPRRLAAARRRSGAGWGCGGTSTSSSTAATRGWRAASRAPSPSTRGSTCSSTKRTSAVCIGASGFPPPDMLLTSWVVTDIPFLAYFLERGVEMHSMSQELRILHLVFLRFVFKEVESASAQGQLTKLTSSNLHLHLKYTLYAGQGAFRNTSALPAALESTYFASDARWQSRGRRCSTARSLARQGSAAVHSSAALSSSPFNCR